MEIVIKETPIIFQVVKFYISNILLLNVSKGRFWTLSQDPQQQQQQQQLGRLLDLHSQVKSWELGYLASIST